MSPASSLRLPTSYPESLGDALSLRVGFWVWLLRKLGLIVTSFSDDLLEVALPFVPNHSPARHNFPQCYPFYFAVFVFVRKLSVHASIYAQRFTPAMSLCVETYLQRGDQLKTGIILPASRICCVRSLPTVRSASTSS